MQTAKSYTKHTRVRLGPQGRIVIPMALRESLGFSPGDELVAWVEDGQLVIEKPEHILERLQSWFSSIPKEISLTDELIAERRAEAEKENREAEAEAVND